MLCLVILIFFFFFFSSRRRHTRSLRDWSSDVCSSDLYLQRHPDAWRELASFFGAKRELLRRELEGSGLDLPPAAGTYFQLRSEERRVGKECRSRWSPYH